MTTDTMVATPLTDDIELNKQRLNLEAQRVQAKFHKQRVHLEAQRVQAKFASSVDTSSEVILRFDFMNNHDTRVCFCQIKRWTLVHTGILQAASNFA